MKKHLDVGSLIVIIITFILFFVALFTKGLTHDILLEAGVLLVSVKVIMMSYKSGLFYKSIQKDLNYIKAILESRR
jgi:hypothetical protein